MDRMTRPSADLGERMELNTREVSLKLLRRSHYSGVPITLRGTLSSATVTKGASLSRSPATSSSLNFPAVMQHGVVSTETSFSFN